LLPLLSLASAPVSASTNSAIEARRLLVSMAETGVGEPSIDRVRSLVESYRIDASPAFLPLATAPYPRFLIYSQLSTLYPALYESTVCDLVGENSLELIPVENLFDQMMTMVAEKKVPESLAKPLKQVSARMARRALEGKSASCPLDLSKDAKKASLVSLLLLKIDAFNFYSPCTYRTRLFSAARESLEGAKSTLPEEFRKGFLEKINTTLADFPKLVGKKFGAGDTVHPIWGPNGSILEASTDARASGGRRLITFRSFAEGMVADLYAARILIRSSLPRDRSLAAGLFYAVVNRWLLLTGGVAADWDETKKGIPVLGDAPAPKGSASELALPRMRPARFGGWGVESAVFGMEMSPWNWERYVATDPENPSPLRIFPRRFEIDSRGVAELYDPRDAVQSNADFALLLLGVNNFLEATQPGTAFAKHFGGKEQAGDLLDAKKPMLFPTEGRMLSVGVLAAVAKNLLHEQMGHVGTKSDGLRLFFRDAGRLPSMGRPRARDVDVVSISRLLVSAAKIARTLEVDPLVAADPQIAKILPEIGNLVQIGALVVGKETQNLDGSFRAKIASSDSSVTVDSQIAGLRILLRSYNETQGSSTFAQARIVPALQYFFSVTLEDTRSWSPSQKMEARAVWNETQLGLRAIRGDLPWSEWESKIRALSER
jgi:hypothetical protein